MRPDGVVVTAPRLDQYSCFSEAVEDLAVEQLIAQRAVEALVVAILPRRTRHNVQRLHANLPEPFLNRGSDELAAVAHWEALVREPLWP